MGTIINRDKLKNWVSASTELEHAENLAKYQKTMIVMLFFTLILVGIMELFMPNFFSYPYFFKMPNLAGIKNFWPLFLYGGCMAYITSIRLQSTNLDEKILSSGLKTSVMAGVWEELGFRWMFIATAMFGIAFSNWLISTFLGVIFGVLCVGVGIMQGIIDGKDWSDKLLGFAVMIAGGVMAYISFCTDPLYLLYDHIVIPLTNFFTFGQFDMIFSNPEYPRLFVFGMIAANAKFRDGHKYQGLKGWFNSWIIGFIMMYAMLNYGLWTAVILHAIYDIEFDVIHYIFRKTDVL